MDFIDEQNGWLTFIFEAIGGRGEDAAHVGHVRFHTAEALEFTFGLAGDDLRERGFSGAGWSVKNKGLNAVGFNGAAEELAGTENMRLTNEFTEVARAHPGGKRLAFYGVRRRRSLGLCFSRGCKQVITRHEEKLTLGVGN